MKAATPQRGFKFLFICVLMDVLALGIVLPVLPKLIEAMYPGAPGRAARMYGLFGTVWAAMQFLASPLLGALSDRFGRRPVLILSSLGLGLDYVFMAVAPTVAWLLVGRMLSGVTSASLTAANAYVADVYPEERAARFGMLGVAMGLGFVLGPAAGGLLGQIHLRLPFWAAATVGLLNAAYGAVALPESLPPESRAPFSLRRVHPLGALWFLNRPRLGILSVVFFLCRLGHVALPSVFVLYVSVRFGWNERTVGLASALMGLLIVGVQAGVLRPFLQRYGKRAALLGGMACGAAGFSVFGLAPGGRTFLLGTPLLALFWGLFGTAIQDLMSARVASSEQGLLQGAKNGLAGIAELVGPALFTSVFAWALAGEHGLKGVPGAAFLLAAALLGVATLPAVAATAPETQRASSEL